jgi:hypothetical protein
MRAMIPVKRGGGLPESQGGVMGEWNKSTKKTIPFTPGGRVQDSRLIYLRESERRTTARKVMVWVECLPLHFGMAMRRA